MKNLLSGISALLISSAAVSSGHAQLAAMSDDFEDAATLSDWQRINVVEGWNADQLEGFDIDTTRSGWMTMMPYSSSWYENWRGVLAFKEVTSDSFAITVSVHTENRAGDSAPGQIYSLAGIMVREPRAITDPTTQWASGGENYVFLSTGAADTPGTYQFEVKTTINSVSVLEIDNAPSSNALIQVARLGEYVIMLRKPGNDPWEVHRRYHRPDFGPTLQAGLTCYTDWNTVSGIDPYTHNQTVYDMTGTPDLVAQFDYVHYDDVVLPAELVGVDLTDGIVTDSELLAFLGQNVATSAVEGWHLF